MDNIIWKRLIYQGNDYGNYYLVSNNGDIKSIKTGIIRNKNINHEGYYFVSISLGSRSDKVTIRIHKAVAESFINNPNNYPIVNHKDGNKLNNNITNLEWCTYKYNSEHAQRMGLINNEKSKKVIKSLSNNTIYNSITEAAYEYKKIYPFKKMDTIRKNINRALIKNSKAYGTKWEYCNV